MSNPFRSLFARRKRASADALPLQGVIYFDHLYATYQSLLASNSEVAKQSIESFVSSLVVKREGQTLSWKDLYAFDLVLTRLSPIGKLSRKVWNLRSRYRDVAG